MSQAISKREKKRTQDRNAQRAARQRTKDRLALLELQVSQLQGGADKALSDELEQMRKERSELRTLTDHLMAIAGAMKSTLGSSDDAPMRPPPHEGEIPNAGLISHIFRDYESLKAVGPTPILPLSDTHIIVSGILNGWDGPVNEDEKPIQRLMAYLHQRFMLERPLARPMDQLGLLYLVQMAFLYLLAQHKGNRYHLSQIPGWLRPLPAQMKSPHNISIDMLPWPQLRAHLLSSQVESAVTTNTEPCESFALHALRNVYFSPQINFEDAYSMGPDRRLAVSPQFQQYFAPDSIACPFAVDSEFLREYPDFHGIIPEFKSQERPRNTFHDASFELSSLSPFSQPRLTMDDCAASESALTWNKTSPFEDKQRPTTETLDVSRHNIQPYIASPLENRNAPKDTDQRYEQACPDGDIAENLCGTELSEHWHDSLDIITSGESSADWLLSSADYVDGNDLLDFEGGS
ncbi:hypothetical protein BO70DRAFT_232722 [Aspergillus heteromorphus CBS 117.55]|uniref:BZIP domain-containing protein n=1 Tax=Aspergillus heteromorphus CBS 117.55 TaxID=1448321 RepID=A0A317WFG7_9EURO|nr:uncharacterized protein BO70DRAFT_232722 [Aspergillus heteromorphus CBS 117.55]PWY85039.1 hypothetical protein BO70DRAFT_232722 [Aspergillus heteromorphus CBS 117.55]